MTRGQITVSVNQMYLTFGQKSKLVLFISNKQVWDIYFFIFCHVFVLFNLILYCITIFSIVAIALTVYTQDNL